MATPPYEIRPADSKELEHCRATIQALLKHVGTPGSCKGCGARILWVYHKDTSRNTPYDSDGVSHFATCPQAAEFRKRKS